MSNIVDGTYEQVGTFNGNPLSMAAAKAMLTEVMVEETYEHLDHIQSRMEKGANEVVGRHELTAHVATAGAKGVSSTAPSRCAPIEISSQSTGATPRPPGSINTIGVSSCRRGKGRAMADLRPAHGRGHRPVSGDPRRVCDHHQRMSGHRLARFMSGVVELVDLAKYFGEHPAVDHIDLRIEDGEFFSLLRAVGMRQTTTLRLIAGFERLTAAPSSSTGSTRPGPLHTSGR